MTQLESYTLITAFAASVAAIASAIAAIYQCYANKKHQNASVIPYICDHYDQTSYHKGSISFSITNKGIGPALIESFEFYWDECLISCTKLEDELISLLGSRFEFITTELGKDQAFSPNETVTVLEINFLQQHGQFNDDHRATLAAFREEAVKKFRLKATYKSVLSSKQYVYHTAPLNSLLQQRDIND
ncbi:hypothetical protein HUZ36_04730 [Pseudoalteromonas sp. McH1-7]|uniref:hypothetical protein n=1 Tax=Pseudoalteromonas sp. McH1-7 TaxID=2745574 RepID=UPI0015924C1F|nr:hypothetical protein [Pseudoalteromonas sp. McH1-7]NUZ10078.1 hypothetical protein [Pseudoalteromonas sp. McH1-7]